MLVAEVEAVKEATGTRIAPYAALALAALRGREPEAAAMIDSIIVDATTSGQGTAIQYAHWAKSVLMNGLGRYEERSRRLWSPASTPGALHRWVGAE